jgi:hypothetical protein
MKRPHIRAVTPGLLRSSISLTLLAGLASACIDASRVNSTCSWNDTRTGALEIRHAADREHLRQDAQVAGELGQRLADVRFRNRPDLGDTIQERCTAALYDTIAVRHAVSRASVNAAIYYRVWWADLLAVYLPIGLLVAFATDWMTRGVCRSFDPEDRVIAIGSVAALVPLAAALGLGIAQFWAFGVESSFIRNEHVAFRAFVIPVMRHGWIGFFTALAVAAVVAFARFRVTPLRKPLPAYTRLTARPARS